MNLSSPSAEVVLITGASSGLGAGMAREFARRGYSLALCARRTDQLQSLAAEIEAKFPGCRVEIAQLDVTDHAAVFTCFRAFRDRFGHIDRVIVNAGIGSGVPVGKGGFARNLAIVETNFTAAFAQAEAAMEIFRDQNKGHLVVISSMSAMRGLRGGMTAYSASKAAVAALAEGIRGDVLKKKGIDVSTIFPGYITTEINADVPKSRTPFIIDGARGARLLVDAIERRRPAAFVPFWPWSVVGLAMRVLPLSIVNRLG